ncbi:MFS transporter [Sphingomonas fuzhouensis]|uniref:MFS transporter n=1 Tax=Sphingomonas fuzhouensis TaxID=3106033 RepID=UPI002AFF536D|nr:MFS transporter [Sphingomonas sp. SGZ-02]
MRTVEQPGAASFAQGSGLQDRNWTALVVYGIAMCVSMSLPVFGGSVVNTAMARAYGWDATSLGLLVVTNMFTTAVLLPGAAKATEKFGVRLSMAAGFVAMIIGAALLATLVHSPYQAMIGYGVLMGVTSAFSGVIPCQTGVAAWFPHRRTVALSLLYAITGVLTFGLIALLGFGIEKTGDWRFGWYVFGGAGLFALCAVIVFVRDPPRTAGADGPVLPGEMPQPGVAVVYPGRSFGTAARSPLFAVIILAMIVCTAGSIFLAAHGQVYLQKRGFALAEAASALSIMQIGMVAGNLCFGLIAPRITLRLAMASALISFGLGFYILANVSGAASLILFALAAGIGFGAGQVGSMALISHYWDHKIFPMLTATALMIQTIGSGVVPVLAGRYYDTHGTYLPPIYVMIIAYGLIAIAITIAGREPRQSVAVQS